ncbi:hypothetical protein BKA82DRAFT_128741 [Pisolithus tinctorius]|uniref:Sorting nexin MVP1 n=1 Tax=Pisolithus tinctorius Marx 270 TaxID=870435 RepID=A0A0C3PPD6_PISTI|nr:hypothetical protein BKA82DRAFT_128741 [Pisolithus tinctorius]KIO10786.1 hypothetical protein M404DRAFT_128741 [Pisolithus tinctorius Marx 270]
MFNAPRAAQRYGPTPVNGLSGSFVDEDPLAISIYDDPWSSIPSSTPPPTRNMNSAFSSVIADAMIPELYHRAFAAVDVTNTGEVSVNALSRVLAISSLPAATIDRIVNLVSSKPRVSSLEFYVALALVALAQMGKDISIEQVAALAAENDLPIPALDIDTLQSSSSSPYMHYRQSTMATIRPPTFAPEDPWNVPRYPSQGTYDSSQPITPITNGLTSTFAGSGLPRDWWNKQDTAEVNILGQQGFILNRYTVYEIKTDRAAAPVHRRYSEFVFLWDCLVRRYPFRLLPALPPKRVQPDAAFLEQRRKGLARFLNAVMNHPVIKEDGLLAIFLSEPSLESWRKQTSISLEEESASKRVDPIEEMSIPSDLEEKLAVVRGKLSPLIEQWQRICILAERMIKRHEAAAVRVPSGLWRTYLPAHFALPLFSPISPLDVGAPAGHPDGHGHTSSTVSLLSDSADMTRLANVLRAIAEVNERCWRGDECDLCDGVRQGIGHVATHTQHHSDLLEERTNMLLYSTLESLKSQRDLYVAMRDLFARHERLAVDNVERLKKRIDSNSTKLESIKAAQKDGWQEDADRVVVLIEKDQATIASLLNRRVFIRACMWHELRVVLHNRENVLLSKLTQTFAREEQSFADRVLANWVSLGNAVEGMPLE